jgi:UDP-glucose 4-epimerase
VLELVDAFTTVNGVGIPWEPYPRREGDVAINYAATDKATADLGWRAARSLEDMCIDAWRWQQTLDERGDKP